MEQAEQKSIDYASIINMKHGANWFFWAAIFSAVNSLIVYFVGTPNFPFALGITQWIDGTTGGLTAEGVTPPLHAMGLVLDLMIAAAVAGFGYLARKGNDYAFVIGIFLYAIDTMLVIGLREFWAFGIHVAIMCLLFRGLLASRHARENATTY